MVINKFVKKHWHQIILVFVLFVLFIKNYIPDTYLLGWDNLVPELNIWINIKRSLFSAWQEYQGLGLVAGMAHASDLIRQIIILPLTLFLPVSLIRYLWHFAMLTIGSFGLLRLLNKHIKLTPFPCFVGSLFYLLNFGTIQNFYVAFEPFSTLWGFFPWLISSLLAYLKKPTKKNLKSLFWLNLLATPSFYVQTNFIVYILCIATILISYFVNCKLKIENSLKILTTIFLINSFWLLPFLYYLISGNINNTTQSFGNLMASQETFMRNLKRGTLADFLLLRGYYYDYSNSTTLLMAPWVSYFQNHYILLIGYLLGFIAIIGIIFSKYTWLKIILALTTIALMSATPPFSWINQILRSSPFLDQVFRSPFTKFIVPTSFIFSLGLPLGLVSITNLFKKLKYQTRKITPIFSILTALLVIIFSLPSFSGDYFYSQTRQKLPRQYANLINFFKTQPKTGRIMNLPQGSFWGWTFYNWNYNGSGFLWYGIEQPILDRAFDVWNLKNEHYYWQLNDALQKQDIDLFNQILSQYDIQYIIFDNNVYFPSEKNYAIQAIKTDQMLKSLNTLKPVVQLDKITVYQTNFKTVPYLTNTIDNTIKGESYSSSGQAISQNLIELNPTPCLSQKISSGFSNAGYTDNYLQLVSQDNPNCQQWHLNNIDLTKANILKITYKNITGHPLTISAFNQTNKYVFNKLPDSQNWITQQYFLPAYTTDSYKSSLSIQIRSPSFNQFNTVNQISQIQLYTAQVQQSQLPPPQAKQYLSSKSSIFLYQIKLEEPNQNTHLVLPQSFDKGWLALYFNGLKPIFLKDHTLINNWANGWNIENLNNQIIYILFWPQLLEFLGFFLLIPTLFYILKSKKG